MVLFVYRQPARPGGRSVIQWAVFLSAMDPMDTLHALIAEEDTAGCGCVSRKNYGWTRKFYEIWH